IVYDNNAAKKPLQPDWGFSCLVRGLEKSILFDTGGKGNILLGNMEKLKISPMDIDLVFLSHYHRDHTGGLSTLLQFNPKIEVWLPKFFPQDFKEQVLAAATSLVEVEGHQKICDGAFTTGVIMGWIKEQSLVLDTTQGLIVVTGCAHPRLINILPKVRDIFGENIHLVLGGFHLAGFQTDEIQEVIDMLNALKIQKIGPCHCTGDKALRMFADEYAENFIKTGAGKEIQ
ncbi:MAG: MBL fold metallo-hydrolase, partial [Candidatus Aminicenantes bacterium]|nr:MBL fold metallo-hydrolase [Candidatus Aminicenantes bacterium]